MGSGTSLAQGATFPSAAFISDVSYSLIRPANGERDLEFSFGYSFGANGFVEVGIIHYNGQTASLSYFQTFPPGQGRPQVIGRAPRQQLRIPVGWLTDADPECCAVRTYVETVGFRVQRLRGGYVSRTYVVTASTQSWLGVYATAPINITGTPSNPVVLSVVAGGPAAGILQPGDQLLSVAGVTAHHQPALLVRPSSMRSRSPFPERPSLSASSATGVNRS